MKKIFSAFLASLIFFFGMCPIALAGGDDKVEVLSDGTVLTYVSTENIAAARNRMAARMDVNRARNFSTAGNVSIKAGAVATGILLCWASSKVENPYLRAGLIGAPAIVSLVAFFYPEYVRYDVDHVENWGWAVRTDNIVFSRQKHGLWGMLNQIEEYLSGPYNRPPEADPSYGIVIVERPKGCGPTQAVSGVYTQQPHTSDWNVRGSIESELRKLREQK